MAIEDQIIDKKLQYDINREAAKISALLLGKIGKYEYLTGEEILPSNQQQNIEQAKFIYSTLRKAFEKQTKTIEDQGKKQVDALESLKPSDKELPSIKDFVPKEKLNPEIANEIKRIEEEERHIDRTNKNQTYDFRKFTTIYVFGNEIRNNIIHMDTANDEQKQLATYVKHFMSKTKPEPQKHRILN